MSLMGRIDVLSALRSLRRSPGVSLAAILSLAFGIAASCAVFSVVDALLLQPLPFADARSLVFHRDCRSRSRAQCRLRARPRRLASALEVLRAARRLPPHGGDADRR